MQEPERDVEIFDTRSRRLCPDGSCIGVIGGEGRCKVCGLADREGSAGAETSVRGVVPDEDPSEVADLDRASADAPEGTGFDPGRKLCVEGSCLGVVGADGRCSECGRSADG
jgi:hypothetical protein